MKNKSFGGLQFLNPVLALGGQQKGGFCLARRGGGILSPDFGDLGEAKNFLAYQASLDKCLRKNRFTPRVIAHDLHPAYSTTELAGRLSERFPTAELAAIQHHHAHIAAVLADRKIKGPVIGLAWDGTGYGDDGAIWGGEFLIAEREGYERAAHLEYVALPGGERAVEEPWRMAVSYLHHFQGKRFLRRRVPFVQRLNRKQLPLLLAMIDKNLNSPLTSSMGRLFDGVSALLGLAPKKPRPAQAAVALEKSAQPSTTGSYRYGLRTEERPYIIELKPLFAALLEEIRRGRDRGEIAGRFHNTIIKMGAEIAGRLSKETSCKAVALSGGVFQNKILTEGLIRALKAGGLVPLLPLNLPVHDGCIAFGQAVAAGAQVR